MNGPGTSFPSRCDGMSSTFAGEMRASISRTSARAGSRTSASSRISRAWV
jgi:hypothetical protein